MRDGQSDPCRPLEKLEDEAKLKSFLYRVICGVVVGIGGVLPGVSGGILAISLGIYEKMMLAIGNIFQSFRKNAAYLLPLAVGVGVGILLASNVLSLLFERYEVQLLSLFAGLVLGSLPELVGEVRLGGQKINWKHLVSAILGLGFVLLFALGESSVTQNTQIVKLTIPGALIAGLVLSVGTVIPGISSSFILVYLGLYPAVIAAIAGVFDISALTSGGIAGLIGRFGETLVPFLAMAAAFALVSLGIIKLVNRMLARHHATSYAAIIGFVLGSVALVLPQVGGRLTWACPLLFAVGLALSLLEFYFKKRVSAREPLPAAATESPAQASEDIEAQ